MKPFTFKYRHFWFSPWLTTVSGEIPERWTDLTDRQLCAVTSLQTGRATEVQFLSAMFGVSPKIIRRTSLFERYMLMEYFEFLRDSKPVDHFKLTHLKLRTSFLPWVTKTAFAPRPKLAGLTFGQFVFCETHFAAYTESKSEDDLNKLIACLYLLRKEKFTEDSAKKSKYIASVPLHIREAVVVNYQLIHEWLSLAYPLIFQKQDPVERSEEESRQVDTSAWIKVFQNFIGDDILHDDLWAAKPVHTIFQYMTRKCKENATKH